MFYVYEHWRTDTNLPFYVGKGKNGRAFVMSRRNSHHISIQKKLKLNGCSVDVKIINFNLSEEEAFCIEVETIMKYRNLGINLANKTDGGEGVSGLIFSEDHRKKLGDANRGKKRPPMSASSREKLSIAMTGKKIRLGARLSDETKLKISASSKGRVSPNKGQPKSEGTKRKISISVSASILGENNPFWGRKHSDETKRKISETKMKAKKNASC